MQVPSVAIPVVVMAVFVIAADIFILLGHKVYCHPID
jgi:hypothetical protein